jgi:eukaryotic-like serine/threonine-protein kinase
MTPERWRQIEDLFHGARALPPDERAAWLAAACADDADLRREVASLLAQEDGTLLREGLAAAASVVMPPPRTNHEGRVLGPYILGDLLGSGGMGDVYRARDERLRRDVAIKLLPDAVAASPERLARFEREARVLGALNHPHIGAIHGLEQSDGLRGLVLELIEGPTLKERLDRGALSIEDSLRIARQVADALHAAHRKGIVHRDLKPSNIALSDRGVVKVLDFGIAKIDDADVAGEPSVVATREGLVLGTVAYMSPEQARGRPVDKRTDIWAFGCVLYEMLTGARPFPGDTTADVLGAVTGREPDWTALPAGTPRRVRDLLRRCLAKDPDRRLHDIADARIEIDDALADPGTPDEQEAAARFSRRGAPMALWALSTLVILAGLTAAWMAWRASDSPANGERGVGLWRVALPLPEGVSVFEIGRGSSVAVSPDGRRIAYVGIVNGQRRLYVRSLDDSNDRMLPGTDDATSPFFSPDGQWIGYIEGTPVGSLKKVSFDGGDPHTVLDARPGTPPGFAVSGGWWASDETIVVSVENPGARGFWQLAATGGTPRRIAERPRDEGGMGWPQLLDRGDALIYTSSVLPGFGGSRIVVRRLPDGEPKTLVERAVYGRVVTTGSGRSYLVYARAEGLEAAAFDPVSLSLTGPSVPMLPGVQTNLSNGALFSVSRSGLLAYVPGGLTELYKTAVWVDREGRETEIGVIRGLGFQYRLSPDGHRIVMPIVGEAERDLAVADLVEGGQRRITFGGIHHMPVWTRDERRIIYAKSAEDSRGNLFMKSAGPSEHEEQLAQSPHNQIPGSVSPDGRWLAYSEDIPERSRDIFLMSLEKPYDRRPLISTPMGDMKPAFSPDGRWLAYQSGGTDTFEIYLASVEGDQQHIPVSRGPGWNPLWSRDGRELYYRTTNPEQGGDMMVVSIDTSGPEPRIAKPRLLFPSPYQGEGDIGPDGRFLLLKFTRQESPTRVIPLIFNWFEELEAKVPHPLSSPR